MHQRFGQEIARLRHGGGGLGVSRAGQKLLQPFLDGRSLARDGDLEGRIVVEPTALDGDVGIGFLEVFQRRAGLLRLDPQGGQGQGGFRIEQAKDLRAGLHAGEGEVEKEALAVRAGGLQRPCGPRRPGRFDELEGGRGGGGVLKEHRGGLTEGERLRQLRGDLKIRIVLQEGLENESLHFAGTGFRRLNRVEFGRFPDGANGEFVLPIGREGGHGHEGRDQQGHEQHWNAVNKKADHRGEE